MRLYDGEDYSGWANSSKLQILGDLPPNHPFLTVLDEARIKYEEQKRLQESNLQSKEDFVKMKRAKRIKEKKAKQQNRIKEEEKKEKQRLIVNSFNESIIEFIDAVTRLKNNSKATLEDLQENRYAKMKIDRLERILSAIERGIAESRLHAGRIING